MKNLLFLFLTFITVSFAQTGTTLPPEPCAVRDVFNLTKPGGSRVSYNCRYGRWVKSGTALPANPKASNSFPLSFVPSEWNADVVYLRGNVVSYSDSYYVAMSPSVNRRPDLSLPYWKALITPSAGDTGAATAGQDYVFMGPSSGTGAPSFRQPNIAHGPVVLDSGGNAAVPGAVVAGPLSAGALAALPATAHGMVWDESSTAGVPAPGVCFVRADATLHKIVFSCNAAAEAVLGGGAATNGTSGQTLTSDGAGGFGTPLTIDVNLVTGAEQRSNRTGTGSRYLTVAGTLAPGNLGTFDADGNFVDSGVSLATLTGGLPPLISTSSLPQATEGSVYSASLSASGGTEPYGWDLATGVLPTGLTLNPTTGALTGTPTTGTASIGFRVTDDNALSRTKTLPVNVAVQTPTADNGSGTYDNDVTVTFTSPTSGSTLNTCTANDADCTPSGGTTNPITIVATGTHACAAGSKSGYVTALHCQSYTLKVATPSTDPAPGTVSSGATVNFSSTTTGGVTRYTTDGTTPTCSTGTLGSSVIVNAPTTYKIIGCKADYTDSDVITATFTLDGPAIQMTDNFTGTGDTNLGTHTADTGQTWTEIGGSVATLDGSGNVQYVSHTASAGAIYKSSLVPPSADYSVCMTTASTNALFNIYGRWNGLVNASGYNVSWTTGPGTGIKLNKQNGGSNTQLGVTATIASLPSGDTICLVMSGSSISLTRTTGGSTTTVGPFTDTSWSSVGTVGFAVKTAGSKATKVEVTIQ
jgi:hypothetical protein